MQGWRVLGGVIAACIAFFLFLATVLGATFAVMALLHGSGLVRGSDPGPFIIVSAVLTVMFLVFLRVTTGLLKSVAGPGREEQSPARRPDRQEEGDLIRELHQGLVRMDSRIESLETIILEQRSSNTERLRTWDGSDIHAR